MNLIHGDCLEVLPTLEADSVDAVVTDPPYGLEFMGKAWDSPLRNGWQAEPGTYHNDTNFLATGDRIRYKAGPAFQAWCEQWGREALRVTKPGGYLLAFGGTRTHHRLVCALEDAGWIIRDELDWIYASGFPKGKANLKPAHEPIVLARKPGPLRPLGIDECRIPGVMDGTWGANQSGSRSGIREGGASLYGQITGEGVSVQHEAGRWPSNVLLSDPELFDQPNPYVVGSGATTTSGKMMPTEVRNKRTVFGQDAGDGYTTIETYGDSGGYSRFFIIPKADRAERERGLTADPNAISLTVKQAHSWVCSKCLRQRVNVPGAACKCEEPGPFVERQQTPRANVHPTVKPIDLMRHLVRLVTPQGGTVLDPFLGSGTTAIACEMEGFAWIGIEREAEYVDVARARITASPRGLGL